MAAWSGYARARQATVQVVDEEAVMRADTRHGSSRPGRARGRRETPPTRRPAGPAGRDVDPAGLERLLEPVVRAAGLDLESVRVSGAGRRRLLRVVVDADGGVDLDDIALVSREASVRLDGTGAMGEAPYTLEVSSPGFDRVLRTQAHFGRFVGSRVFVELKEPRAGRRRYTGKLLTVDEAGIALEVDREHVTVSFAEIGKARLAS